MPVSMFPEEQAQFDSDLFNSQPFNAAPGFFTGSLMAIPKGIATGLGKGGELAGTIAAQTVGTVIRAEQAAAPWSRELGQLDPEQFRHNVDSNADAYLKATRADPQTVGTAGQILHTVADVGTRFLAAPEAAVGAVAVGTTEFAPAQREFESQGIDKDTAQRLAAAQAVLAGAGALLPGGVGARAAVRVASGATINFGVGAASRYNTHQVLADAGYPEQAAQYRVLDGQAMAADVLLGSFFGWMHHPDEPFATPKVPQEVADAGLELLKARQAEIDLAPGVPKTQQARDAHIQALDATEAALVKGEELPVVPVTENLPVYPVAEATPVQTIEAEGAAPKPLYEMTAEELDQYQEQSLTLLRREESRILGSDAERWRKARSEKVREDIEQAHGIEVESEDWWTLYGNKEGKSRLHPDVYEADPQEGDIRQYKDAIGRGSVESMDEAVEELKYALSKLGRTEGSDPANWTTEQKLAYVTMREVRSQIEAHGWDMAEIQRRAMKAAAGRFYDVLDAEFMLERFLNRTPVSTADLPLHRQPLAMLPNPAQDAAREAAATEQADAAAKASDGLVSATKRANEPPKTTEQWVREQIARERDAARAAKAAEAEKAGEPKPAENPIDPETQHAIDAIDSALASDPSLHDFEFKDPDTGEVVKASDALEQLREQALGDKDTATLHEIAAACGGRA